MFRAAVMILVIALALTVCVVCGISIQESVVIVVAGIFSLGFLGWIAEGFRFNLFRSILFWWISKMLDKPELLYRD
jgi:hypothetical protein